VFFVGTRNAMQVVYWDYVWFFGQVGQTEGIYWECVWFGGRGRAVRMYILRVRMI